MWLYSQCDLLSKANTTFTTHIASHSLPKTLLIFLSSFHPLLFAFFTGSFLIFITMETNTTAAVSPQAKNRTRHHSEALHHHNNILPFTSILLIVVPIIIVVLLLAILLIVVTLRRIKPAKRNASSMNSSPEHGNCMFIAHRRTAFSSPGKLRFICRY